LEPRDERCEGCEYGAKCREDEWADVADNGLVQIEMPARWKEFRDLDAIEKDAAKAKKELRPLIDKAIGDNEVVRIGNDKVTCKPVETWRVDVDILKKQYPGIAKELMYRSLSRPLRVYPIKEKK
jgi:predicted phage-related endonuclease